MNKKYFISFYYRKPIVITILKRKIIINFITNICISNFVANITDVAEINNEQHIDALQNLINNSKDSSTGKTFKNIKIISYIPMN